MAEDKLEWFPLYWQRMTIGTLQMSAEEIGAYMLLLIHQWDKGFVPANEKDLRKISRVSIKKLEKVLKKFEKFGDKLVNDTLEIIRIEQEEKASKRSNSGKNAARIKYERIANAKRTDSEKMPLREEENREDKNRIEEREKEDTLAPELKFDYMIGEDEILSIHEVFKEKFLVLYNTVCSQYGELKIIKWTDDFSMLHKQKTWKDYQDFRQHLSSYFTKRQQTENDSTKNGHHGSKKGIGTTIPTNQGKPAGKL